MEYERDKVLIYEKNEENKAIQCIKENMGLTDDEIANKTMSIITELSKYIDFIYCFFKFFHFLCPYTIRQKMLLEVKLISEFAINNADKKICYLKSTYTEKRIFFF